ncbi:MAG: hypothetical protein ACYCS1_08725 [Gammaproteobacteria bacterium]
MFNQLFALGNLGPAVIIGLIFLSLLFGSLFLMLSFRIFLKFMPSFGKALTIMLASFATIVLVDLLLGWFMRDVPFVGKPILWIINFAVMFWIVQQMQRRPDGQRLRYLTVALVTLGSFFLEFVVLVLLWLVVHEL